MPLLAMLKAHWTLFGLEAPQFIWVAAMLLLGGTFVQMVHLWWLVSSERALHERVMAQLEAISAAHGAPGREGLSEAVYDAVVQVFHEHRPLLSAWRNFDAQMLSQSDATGQNRLWATASAGRAFNTTTVIEPRLNQNFFAAVPGMVTGTGLLCTFGAILVALLDVRLVDGQFQGLDTLISGLSGKFLSSIAALLAATCFLAVERSLSYHLSTSLHHLVATLDGLVPRLSPTTILATMQRDVAEQRADLQLFNADFATRLQQGMREGMGPSLERMVTTLQDMTHHLHTTETHQQESLARSLSGLVQKFEQSLEGMNTQFLTMQQAFGDMMVLAKHATTEQMALGKTQVEDVTTALEGFMGQMHAATGLSVHQMAAALTTVVYDLSTKVAELGQQMTQIVVDSAGEAAEAARTVIDKADGWSARSAAQLTQLLEQQQGQVTRSQEVQTAFDATLGQFKEALTQYTIVTTHLRQIAAAAASITKAINETGATVERTASMAGLQAERFAETVRRQEDIQHRVAQSMQQYQQVFSQATQATSDLLTHMEQHLHRYTTLTAQGFEDVLQTAEAHLTQAAQHLGDTVHGLDEHLQEFIESLEKHQHTGGAHGSPRG